MPLRFFLLVTILITPPSTYADPICAENYTQLDASPTLQKIKTLLRNSSNNGFVNKTKGSYFFIQTQEEKFKIIFYTTGFLNLYGIQKEGPIKFCDEGDQLTVIGIDRHQKLYVDGNSLEFGSRTDRESFARGVMPEELARKNNVDPLFLAGDNNTDSINITP